MNRRLLIINALFVTALVIISNPVFATPVRIAYSSISAAMLPLWVAKEKGLFDKRREIRARGRPGNSVRKSTASTDRGICRKTSPSILKASKVS